VTFQASGVVQEVLRAALTLLLSLPVHRLVDFLVAGSMFARVAAVLLPVLVAALSIAGLIAKARDGAATGFRSVGFATIITSSAALADVTICVVGWQDWVVGGGVAGATSLLDYYRQGRTVLFAGVFAAMAVAIVGLLLSRSGPGSAATRSPLYRLLAGAALAALVPALLSVRLAERFPSQLMAAPDSLTFIRANAESLVAVYGLGALTSAAGIVAGTAIIVAARRDSIVLESRAWSALPLALALALTLFVCLEYGRLDHLYGGRTYGFTQRVTH
jgi:hypothetical protein